MPTSVNVFDGTVKRMIELCNPKSIVDLGPGQGKYGKMLREIERETRKRFEKTCVEIDREKVIERYDLKSIYDHVIHEDAARLPYQYPELTGDLVVCGDMIEHITKSQGIDLIEFLQYRFRHIFLVIPVDWICLSYEDHRHEPHISIWRPEDIARFHGGYCVQRQTEDGHKFVLAVINKIVIPPERHFVVRDKAGAPAGPLLNDEMIEFGYLNRAA